MNILGLQAFYHNHATALLTDSTLRCFIEEEKINRVKGQRDGFPLQSLKWALKDTGLTLRDIDEIAFPIDPWRYTWTVAKGGLASLFGAFGSQRGSVDQNIGTVSLFPDRVLTALQYTPPFLGRLIAHHIRFGGIAGPLPPVRFVPHHQAHAASAFYTSGFDEAAVVIVDGMGETESTTIWHGHGKSLKRLATIKFPNSLGEFYAAFTELCGFKTYQQEGKLMGLAAYGGPDARIDEQMRQVIRIGREHYQVAPKYTIHGPHSYGVSFSDHLVGLFGAPRRPDEPFTDRHRALAYAAQDRLEKATMEVVRKAVRLTGCRNLCLSGGVAMNCKLNGAVLHSGLVDELYVLPSANDAGVALGAALDRSMARGVDPRFRLEHTYYGPKATTEQIEAVLQNVKIPYQRLDLGDFREVVDLLLDRKVVGLFTGRNEFGARALGARSILADPRYPEMWDIVNESVKHREKWRPFAPVILEGFEGEYFVDGQPSRYMMKAFEVRPEKRDEIPAVVHVDGTCRPQSIARANNPVYFDILEAFHQATGVPVLMNTSFNVRGEPIVSTPVEAVRCFLGTGMDALVIGPFLVRKDRLGVAESAANQERVLL